MRIERAEWDGAEAPAFAGRLRALAPADDAVTADVARIVERVRTGGDAGLREVAERLDEAVPESFRVDPEAVAAAPGLLEPEVRDAMRVAARQHRSRSPRRAGGADAPGDVRSARGPAVEVRDEPIATAGVYARGEGCLSVVGPDVSRSPRASRASRASAWRAHPALRAGPTLGCSRPACWRASTRSTPWAEPRRSRPWPSARRRSIRST